MRICRLFVIIVAVVHTYRPVDSVGVFCCACTVVVVVVVVVEGTASWVLPDICHLPPSLPLSALGWAWNPGWTRTRTLDLEPGPLLARQEGYCLRIAPPGHLHVLLGRCEFPLLQIPHSRVTHSGKSKDCNLSDREDCPGGQADRRASVSVRFGKGASGTQTALPCPALFGVVAVS